MKANKILLALGLISLTQFSAYGQKLIAESDFILTEPQENSVSETQDSGFDISFSKHPGNTLNEPLYPYLDPVNSEIAFAEIPQVAPGSKEKSADDSARKGVISIQEAFNRYRNRLALESASGGHEIAIAEIVKQAENASQPDEEESE